MNSGVSETQVISYYLHGNPVDVRGVWWKVRVHSAFLAVFDLSLRNTEEYWHSLRKHGWHFLWLTHVIPELGGYSFPLSAFIGTFGAGKSAFTIPQILSGFFSAFSSTIVHHLFQRDKKSIVLGSTKDESWWFVVCTQYSQSWALQIKFALACVVNIPTF